MCPAASASGRIPQHVRGPGTQNHTMPPCGGSLVPQEVQQLTCAVISASSLCFAALAALRLGSVTRTL